MFVTVIEKEVEHMKELHWQWQNNGEENANSYWSIPY